MKALLSLTVGVAICLVAVFAPITLVFLFLIWVLHKQQQADSIAVHEQYANQRYELHFPEEPPEETIEQRIEASLEADIEKAVSGGSNVIRFPKR